MNYSKIYQDFIESRKFIPKLENNYYEKHHIIPKSLGGDNSKENLIYLSFEDHYMAHLLLARIYGGKMWTALTAMMMERDGRPCINRKMFAKAKLESAKSRSDNTLYEFLDIRTDKIFKATRKELSEKYKIKYHNVNSLIKGRTFCTGFISLSSTEWPKYTILNYKTGEYITGNKEYLAYITNTPRHKMFNLLRGSWLKTGDYTLPKNIDKIPKKARLKQLSTGKIFEGDAEYFHKNFGFHEPGFYNLLRGGSITAHGFSLEYTDTSSIFFIVENNKTKERFYGSKANIIKLTGMSRRAFESLVSNKTSKVALNYTLIKV